MKKWALAINLLFVLLNLVYFGYQMAFVCGFISTSIAYITVKIWMRSIAVSLLQIVANLILYFVSRYFLSWSEIRVWKYCLSALFIPILGAFFI